MALKVRASDISIHGGDSDDATVFVNVEVFDDANGQVIASNVLQYSLLGFQGATTSDMIKRVRNDATVWARDVKASATAASPLLSLQGIAVDIPDGV